MPEQLDDISTGDLAEAWNIQRLIDLIKGVFGYPVSLTKHSGPLATLKLRNGLAGAPILDVVGVNGTDLVLRITDQGLSTSRISTYLDLSYQSAAPSAPLAGTNTLRVYSRNGQLYFKTPASIEQQIPIGLPPGPSLRYGFWQGQ